MSVRSPRYLVLGELLFAVVRVEIDRGIGIHSAVGRAGALHTHIELGAIVLQKDLARNLKGVRKGKLDRVIVLTLCLIADAVESGYGLGHGNADRRGGLRGHGLRPERNQYGKDARQKHGPNARYSSKGSEVLLPVHTVLLFLQSLGATEMQPHHRLSCIACGVLHSHYSLSRQKLLVV